PRTALVSLSLHDALPILPGVARSRLRPATPPTGELVADRRDVVPGLLPAAHATENDPARQDTVVDQLRERFRRICRRDYILEVLDRKSTRLNSSHLGISY